MQRRIRVKGVKREVVSTDDLAYVYFTLGKQNVIKKRERAEAERQKRVAKERRHGG